MRMAALGALATGITICVGVVIAIGPSLVHTIEHNHPPPVMLSFSVTDSRNVPQWCEDLSSILAKHKVKATVFVTGKIAEEQPGCVGAFAAVPGVDIGSQTYSYARLPSIDYLEAQEEVRQGKLAVDRAGNIDSKLFRAPYGATDQNIYSLLSDADIEADFSYVSQYNKYEGGQFVRYDLVSCDCGSAEEVRSKLNLRSPVMIEMDNSSPAGEIEGVITGLKGAGMHLTNASELTGLDLTVRGQAL
jgi:peptidoglycan/xylan/chitin deacetylase (PgdA/CDA1 family)